MKDTVEKGTGDARTSGAPVFECVVGTSVVAAVAVRTAAAVPGVVRIEPGLVGLVSSVVRSARQRLRGSDPAPTEGARVEFEPAADGTDGTDGSVRVQLDVVISGQDQAMAVGRAVQRAVSGAVTEATGLTVSEVDVSIIDIRWDLDRR